jgi:hypothetical protein
MLLEHKLSCVCLTRNHTRTAAGTLATELLHACSGILGSARLPLPGIQHGPLVSLCKCLCRA